MKQHSLGVVLSLLLLLCTGLGAANLKPGRYGSVYPLGEYVRFIPDSDEFTRLEGIVYDSNGRKVAQVISDSSALKRSGWQWKPEQTGFYEIEFRGLNKNGKTNSLSKRYETANETFTRNRFAVGVVPPALPMEQRSEVFGFSDQRSSLKIYDVAYLLGFRFARVQAIGWGAQFSNAKAALEPERGKYHWQELDKHIKELNKRGFKIVGNFLYTPRWASSHPGDTEKNICVLGYNAYAPKKMEYLTEFIRELVNHYGKSITTWEVWNEPNLPGQSCFWKDTPENFIKMFIAASKAFRQYQPDCELWVGGLGTRSSYIKFYRIVMSKGLGQYFDKLAVHGKLSEARPFYQVDQQLKLKSKPWVASESHDILYNQTPNVPNENQVALELVKNTLLKLKHKAERIALFEMINLAEPETLPLHFKLGNFTHSSGLMRRKPMVEPRLAAVVYRIFTDMMGLNSEVTGEYKLDGGKVHAVAIKNNAGFTLLAWNTLSASAACPALLQKIVRSNGVKVIDWEGKSISNFATAKMPPRKIYYISGISQDLLKQLQKDKASILVNDFDQTDERMPKTVKIITPENKSQWITEDWKFVGIGKNIRPKNFSAAFKIVPGPKALELQIKVNDSHLAESDSKDGKLWDFDSIQFALDTSGNGKKSGIVEFVAANTAEGPYILKNLTPDFEGDLPSNYTTRKLPLKYGKTKISHPKPKITLYDIKIDWSELYPFVFEKGKAMRMSLLINGNNGKGRLGWLEWGKGIGETKSAEQYGAIYFATSNNLLTRHHGWTAWNSNDADGKGKWKDDSYSVKVGAKGNHSENAVQLLRSVNLAPHKNYLLMFSAESSASNIIKAGILLNKKPWTRYVSKNIRIEKSKAVYTVNLNTANLPDNTEVKLHLFFGSLPQCSLQIKDLKLFRLD